MNAYPSSSGDPISATMIDRRIGTQHIDALTFEPSLFGNDVSLT